MILFQFKSVLYQGFLFMPRGFITQEHATSNISMYVRVLVITGWVHL